MKYIINADDFGFSKGANLAIIKSFLAGCVNSISIGSTAQYAKEAIDLYHKNKDKKPLKIGLHFNLTSGSSALHSISIPLLVDKNGNFKNGFIKLFLLSIHPFKRREFLAQVQIELAAQVEILTINNIKLSHIDGHRHVHFIPAIFKIVAKFAKNQSIERVRVINEHFFATLKSTKKFALGGFAKWCILRFFSLFNEPSEYYFYSILHSCQMRQKYLENLRIPPQFKGVEIMLHPGSSEIDKNDQNLQSECNHLRAKNRDIESDIIFHKI